MVAILLAGLVAFRFLPLSALPEVDYPTIQVLTLYPGASPDVMTLVGDRAARAPVRADAGLDPMSSTSSRGASIITLQFSLDSRSTSRSRKCRPRSTPRLAAARRSAGAAVYAKVIPADAPVLTLGADLDSCR